MPRSGSVRTWMGKPFASAALPECFLEELERGLRERVHVREPIAASRLDDARGVLRTGNADRGVTRAVAVAAPRRARCAAFTHAPRRVEVLAHEPRTRERRGFGAGLQSLQRVFFRLR